MATPGTLYLVPVALAYGAGVDQLAPETVRVARTLDRFIVEGEKSARQALKAMAHPAALATLDIQVLDEHTPAERIGELLQPLLAGRNVGLMSEAGCPAVADPGAALVARAHELGIKVVPLVGPSSILLALMAAGLDGQRFRFLGYLPVPAQERERALRELERRSHEAQETQIFIETPYRNDVLFASVLRVCAATTRVCVAADLGSAAQFIRTRSIAQWRADVPRLDRRPCVFLLLAAPTTAARRTTSGRAARRG